MTNVSITDKVVTLCRLKKWLFLLDKHSIFQEITAI